MQSHDLFIKLTIRRLKRKQKQHLTARKNAGISNNGLNSTDRPRKPIGYSDATARIEPLVLNRSKPFCGDEGRRGDRRSQ